MLPIEEAVVPESGRRSAPTSAAGRSGSARAAVARASAPRLASSGGGPIGRAGALDQTASGFDAPSFGRRAEIANDLGQRSPLDELHGVEVHAAVGADREDRHDVAMVQIGRRLRLGLKPQEVPRVHRRGERQYLQGDPAAERNLHRLVDDSHAASANLSDDLVVAEHAGPGVSALIRRDGPVRDPRQRPSQPAQHLEPP